MPIKWGPLPEDKPKTPFELDMDEIAKTQDRHLDENGDPQWALILEDEWAAKAVQLRDKYPDFEFAARSPLRGDTAPVKNKLIFTRFRGTEYGIEQLRRKREYVETRGRKKGPQGPGGKKLVVEAPTQASERIIRPIYGDEPPPPRPPVTPMVVPPKKPVVSLLEDHKNLEAQR